MSEVNVLPKGVTLVENDGMSIVYSGVEAGNMDLRFGTAEEVQANRTKLLQMLSPARYVVQVPQLGGDFLDLSDTPDDELAEEYPTDGLFIDRFQVALGLNPADCIAMAVYDTESSALGVIHAGRQGVDAGIHEAAIGHMVNKYGVGKDDIRLYFGPSIHWDSYFYPEISAEQLADPKWNRFIDRRNGNYHIDLVGRVIKDLVELSIDPTNIQMPNVDVGSDPAYFSHTRSNHTGEPEGRNGFAAMLTGD